LLGKTHKPREALSPFFNKINYPEEAVIKGFETSETLNLSQEW